MKITDIKYIIIFLVISNLSLALSAFFRFDNLNTFFYSFEFFLYNFLMLSISTLISFYLLGLNKVIWKYLSRQELIRIIFFSFTSIFIYYLVNFLINRLNVFPRSFLPLHIFFNTFFILLFNYKQNLKLLIYKEKIINSAEKSIIIGISDRVVQFIKFNENMELYNIKTIFDLNNNLKNYKLRSIYIKKFDLNLIENQIPKVDNIFIDPSLINDHLLTQLTDLSIKNDFKIININNYLIDQSQFNSKAKKLDIENLIPKLNFDDYQNNLNFYFSKIIIITGVCGSIGSEIAKKLIKLKGIYLVCLDINEERMMDLQIYFNHVGFKNYSFELCNLYDPLILENIFSKYKPNICFHAAASKHVPFVEISPELSLQNNISTTINLIKICHKFKIDKFTFISSDKAVNPNNIMGLTKRVAEIYLLNFKKKYPNFDIRIIRFGNVLNSSGSVIPIFKRNISYGQKIQITHPDIKRFFMSIEDAVRLVILSNTISNHQNNNRFDIFILDMGEQIKIIDLAKKFLIINNLSLTNLDSKFLGLRAGEKLYEELNYNFEKKHITNIKNIYGVTMNENISFNSNQDIENLVNKNISRKEIKKILERTIGIQE